MKIPCEEFVDVLKDKVPYQWKLEFEKEGFALSSSTLKEVLDICIRLEEAEIQKPLFKKTCAIKEHGNSDRKKPKLHHKRHQSLSKHYKKFHKNKHHGGKRRKKFCDNHGLCYHATDKCNFNQTYRKHTQPRHCITAVSYTHLTLPTN
eukprot:12852493-Ditylum_brightwellii.AAC.1